jgi:hypothetical protein
MYYEFPPGLALLKTGSCERYVGTFYGLHENQESPFSGPDDLPNQSIE